MRSPAAEGEGGGERDGNCGEEGGKGEGEGRRGCVPNSSGLTITPKV